MAIDGIVLIHGSNLSAACWAGLTEHLVLPSIAVDLPGRGSRPADVLEVTLDDCVQAVVESADAAGFHRFALVGHSLGGVVATETTQRCPHRVAAVVYVGALTPAPECNAAGLIFGDDLPESEPRTTSEERARLFFANDMSEEQWADVWPQFVPESPKLWNARTTRYPDDIPMTYVSLTDDVGVPPESAQQMIANIGTQVEHVVLSAGHIAMVTRPQELANAINRAIDG